MSFSSMKHTKTLVSVKAERRIEPPQGTHMKSAKGHANWLNDLVEINSTTKLKD